MRNPPQRHALRGILLAGDEKRRLDEWREVSPGFVSPIPGACCRRRPLLHSPVSAAAAGRRATHLNPVPTPVQTQGDAREPHRPNAVLVEKRTHAVRYPPENALSQCVFRQGPNPVRRPCSSPPLAELGACRNLSRSGGPGCRGAGWAATALCHPVMRRAATRVAAAGLRSSAWRTRQDTRR